MNDDRDFTSSDDRNSFFGNIDNFSCKNRRDCLSNVPIDDSVVESVIEGCYLYSKLRDYKDGAAVLCRLMDGIWSWEEENAYLRDLWEWESSAIKPVIEWLDPAPKLIDPKTATDEEVASALYDLCVQLRQINQAFSHIDHLSDRCLYGLLTSKVLPYPVKYLPHGSPVPWEFCYYRDKKNQGRRCSYEFVWLTYYATEAERDAWLRSGGSALPAKLDPPYKREGFPFV